MSTKQTAERYERMSRARPTASEAVQSSVRVQSQVVLHKEYEVHHWCYPDRMHKVLKSPLFARWNLETLGSTIIANISLGTGLA